MKVFVPLLMVLACALPAADQAELWMQDGLKILREKPDSLVQAAGLFAKAADAYEAKGDEAKAVEANSCLYWTRKKFTVRETGIIVQGNPAAAKRMEKLVSEKPKEEDAQGYFDRAEAFAKGSKDHLLTAIRYFEVADRFPTTEHGRKAMDASLKAMQQVGVKETPNTQKPAVQLKHDDSKLPRGYEAGWILAKYGAKGAHSAEPWENERITQPTGDQYVVHGILLVPAGKTVIRIKDAASWGAERFKATVDGGSAVRQNKAEILVKIKSPNDKFPTMVEIKWTWEKQIDDGASLIDINYEWIFDEKEDLGWVKIPKEAMAHTPAIKAKYEKK